MEEVTASAATVKSNQYPETLLTTALRYTAVYQRQSKQTKKLPVLKGLQCGKKKTAHQLTQWENEMAVI